MKAKSNLFLWFLLPSLLVGFVCFLAYQAGTSIFLAPFIPLLAMNRAYFSYKMHQLNFDDFLLANEFNFGLVILCCLLILLVG